MVVYGCFSNEIEFCNRNHRVGLCFDLQVVVAAAERCLDPVPLDQPILDKLIQVKVAKSSEQNLNP